MPESRELLQSQLLVWTVGSMLLGSCLPCFFLMLHPQQGTGRYCLEAFGISLTFGMLVWALKAATPMAAICGSMVCLLVTAGTMRFDQPLLRSGLTPLGLLFGLTFLATRIGKHRRPDLVGAREARRGRSASQVVANLGVAGLVVAGGYLNWYDWISPNVSGLYSISVLIFPALVLAALAEATADTVSSELGQAFGGTPYMLTTLRRAAPGTDGAISLLGSTTGIAAAAAVTMAGAWAMRVTLHDSSAALAGAIAGLFFDSLLGATVEPRGWLNNDLVNFMSTAFAAACTLALLAV